MGGRWLAACLAPSAVEKVCAVRPRKATAPVPPSAHGTGPCSTVPTGHACALPTAEATAPRSSASPTRGRRRTSPVHLSDCLAPLPFAARRSQVHSKQLRRQQRLDDRSSAKLLLPPEGVGPMTIRVLIADDHAVVRQGLRAFLSLSEDLETVGEAVDGRQAVELAHRLRPDLVLMDLLMPGADGINATATIRRELPTVQVLALSGYLDDHLIADALHAGAVGYLLKDTAAGELHRAIRAAAVGQVQLSADVAARLVRDVHLPGGPPRLTRREEEVIVLPARGRADGQTPRELHTTPRSARTAACEDRSRKPASPPRSPHHRAAYGQPTSGAPGRPVPSGGPRGRQARRGGPRGPRRHGDPGPGMCVRPCAHPRPHRKRDERRARRRAGGACGSRARAGLAARDSHTSGRHPRVKHRTETAAGSGGAATLRVPA